MSLNYNKTVRGLYLLLFSTSSIFSFFKSSEQTVVIAFLCLLGLVAHDVVCYFKDKEKAKSESFEDLNNKIDEVAKDLNDIKSDHSLAHLAATFKRK